VSEGTVFLDRGEFVGTERVESPTFSMIWVPGAGYVRPYLYSGDQTVTWSAIPPPIRVVLDAAAPSPSGTLVFRADGPVEEAFAWYWMPNDTGDKPLWPTDRINQGYGIRECQWKAVCPYKPAGSGRMYFYGRSGGGAGVVVSPVIDPTRQLTLECKGPDGRPNTVVRGSRIDCALRAEPGSASGAITVTGWQFTGTDFTYPDIAAGDDAPTGTTWGGEMAMSGTITVKAKVNGVDRTASASVTVTPREEFKRKQVQVSIRPGTLEDVPVEQGRPEDPPNDVTDLGRAITFGSILGYEPGENADELLRILRMIQHEGPNHGLAYLKEVLMQPNAVVVIHPALTRGSVFYRAQPQTSNVVSGTKPCVQSGWNTYVRLVEEHEGLHGNRNSHVGAYQAALNPAAAEAVEHVVGRTSNLTAMATEWIQLLTPVAEKARQQSSNEVFHNTSEGRVQFGCEFNFNVQGR
jgi:hypothetical protein